MIVGGFATKLKAARLVCSGEKLSFRQEKYRIFLNGLSANPADPICGVSIIALEFESAPEFTNFAARPPLKAGRIFV
jgi:hypothetical protein